VITLNLKPNSAINICITKSSEGDHVQVTVTEQDQTQEANNERMNAAEALWSNDKSLYLYVYTKNSSRIQNGFFVVGNELITRLYVRLLAEGYKIPYMGATGHRIRPDKSVSTLFHKHLLNNHTTLMGMFFDDDFTDEQGNTFRIRQYRNKLLPEFVEYFETVWLLNHAAEYFETRDPDALVYLERIIQRGNDQGN
jgi:hypothetical protein